MSNDNVSTIERLLETGFWITKVSILALGLLMVRTGEMIIDITEYACDDETDEEEEKNR